MSKYYTIDGSIKTNGTHGWPCYDTDPGQWGVRQSTVPSKTELLNISGFGGETNNKCYDIMEDYATRSHWDNYYKPGFAAMSEGGICSVSANAGRNCFPDTSTFTSVQKSLKAGGEISPDAYLYPYTEDWQDKSWTFAINTPSEALCKNLLIKGTRPSFRITKSESTGDKERYLTTRFTAGTYQLLISTPIKTDELKQFWWFEGGFGVAKDQYRIHNCAGDATNTGVVMIDPLIGVHGGSNANMKLVSNGSPLTLTSTLWTIKDEGGVNFIIITSVQNPLYIFYMSASEPVYSYPSAAAKNLTGDWLKIEPVTITIPSIHGQTTISKDMYNWNTFDGSRNVCHLYPTTIGSVMIPKERGVFNYKPTNVADIPEYTTTDNISNVTATDTIDIPQTIINYYNNKDIKNKLPLGYIRSPNLFKAEDKGKKVTYYTKPGDHNECYNLMKKEQKDPRWTIGEDKSNVPILASYMDIPGKSGVCEIFNLPHSADSNSFIYGYPVPHAVLNSDVKSTAATTQKECIRTANLTDKGLVSYDGSTKVCKYNDYAQPSPFFRTIIDMEKVFESYKDCALKEKDEEFCTHWGSAANSEKNPVDQVMDGWCRAKHKNLVAQGEAENELTSWPEECYCIAADYLKNKTGDKNKTKLDTAWESLPKSIQDTYNTAHKLCVIDECWATSGDGKYFRPSSVTTPLAGGKPPCDKSICSVSIEAYNSNVDRIGCGDGETAKYACVDGICRNDVVGERMYETGQECSKNCSIANGSGAGAVVDDADESSLGTILIIFAIVVVLIAMALIFAGYKNIGPLKGLFKSAPAPPTTPAF